VAELVDARDLKCLAPIENTHLFWKTRYPNTIETDGTNRDLENDFRVQFQCAILLVTSVSDEFFSI
jgi:hypothetical protein